MARMALYQVAMESHWEKLTLTSSTNITRSLEFSPLRTTYDGQYSCIGLLSHHLLLHIYSLTRSVTVDVAIQVGGE